MNDQIKHKKQITKNGVSISVEGEKEYVDEEFDTLVEEHLSQVGNQSETGEIDDDELEGETSKPPSLAELYRDASIPYKRDTILLIGWSLEKMEGQDDFTRSDIKDRATSAKIELGKNLPRDMNSLIEQGRLQQVGERDGDRTYYLTRSGEEYVETEMDLPEDVVNRFGGVV